MKISAVSCILGIIKMAAYSRGVPYIVYDGECFLHLVSSGIHHELSVVHLAVGC